jgi:DUF1009 family protein
MRSQIIESGNHTSRMSAASSTLGIIAGGGHLPAQLVESCQAMGRPVFVLAFEDSTDIESIRHVPHEVVRLGAVGEALKHLRNAGAKELVLAGKIRRPSITSLRPDVTGAKLLGRLGGAFFSGDDALLKAVIAFLEEEGFKVVGSDEILAGLMAPLGVLGKITPDARAKADIAHGMKVAKTLGQLDVGQAVIVENGYVLGMEAAEGTDALIERCAKLRREAKSGVLIKASKPEQETRADLPAIGPSTIEKLHDGGFCGVAIEADGGIILEREKTIARADTLGLFVVGVHHE